MAVTPRDRWGAFPRLARAVPEETFALVDARVAELHPAVPDALRSVQGMVVLKAGEQLKQLSEVERILQLAVGISRQGTLLAVGGGTLGDAATVVAHLHKRGIRLVLVPTTLLAAVDSSVGGKGAVNLGLLKNAAGVFHTAAETWLCPELFGTLSAEQIAEGKVEAWKMAACFDGELWRAYSTRTRSLDSLIKEARRLKRRVCAADPLDAGGKRQFLNFGHTFGHVLESLSSHRLPHGAAVRLGVVCALDVGRALRMTPQAIADQVQAGFEPLGEGRIRAELARWLRGADEGEVEQLLSGDKKGSEGGSVQMVLLRSIARPVAMLVGRRTWLPLLQAWREGRVP
jgi:3-dehydroquinate synthase